MTRGFKYKTDQHSLTASLHGDWLQDKPGRDPRKWWHAGKTGPIAGTDYSTSNHFPQSTRNTDIAIDNPVPLPGIEERRFTSGWN